eukprot:1168670_1
MTNHMQYALLNAVFKALKMVMKDDKYLNIFFGRCGDVSGSDAVERLRLVRRVIGGCGFDGTALGLVHNMTFELVGDRVNFIGGGKSSFSCSGVKKRWVMNMAMVVVSSVIITDAIAIGSVISRLSVGMFKSIHTDMKFLICI